MTTHYEYYRVNIQFSKKPRYKIGLPITLWIYIITMAKVYRKMAYFFNNVLFDRSLGSKWNRRFEKCFFCNYTLFREKK